MLGRWPSKCMAGLFIALNLWTIARFLHALKWVWWWPWKTGLPSTTLNPPLCNQVYTEKSALSKLNLIHHPLYCIVLDCTSTLVSARASWCLWMARGNSLTGHERPLVHPIGQPWGSEIMFFYIKKLVWHRNQLQRLHISLVQVIWDASSTNLQGFGFLCVMDEQYDRMWWFLLGQR